MQVYGLASDDTVAALEAFRDRLGLSFPILVDADGAVHRTYAMEMAFSSAAYPQDWIVGVDGLIAYANNAFEPDEMRAVLERQLLATSD